jgi:ribonuclease PH
MSGDGGVVEVQATGEKRPFTRAELSALIDLADSGCRALFAAQRAALG